MMELHLISKNLSEGLQESEMIHIAWKKTVKFGGVRV